MKPIKFDLPINGTKVRNLEELRDNFTTEILDLQASGLLLKWLKSRNRTKELEKIGGIPIDQNAFERMVGLCNIFEVEADKQIIEAALAKASGVQGTELRASTEDANSISNSPKSGKQPENITSLAKASSSDIVENQRKLLKKLNANSDDVVRAITKQVWGSFEKDILRLTDTGVFPEHLSVIASSMAHDLASSFDRELNQRVFSCFKTLIGELQQAVSGMNIDIEGIESANMREIIDFPDFVGDLDLYRVAEKSINKAIKRAAPSTIKAAAGLIFGKLFLDPLEQLESWENDVEETMARVREELFSLEDFLQEKIREETLKILRSSHLSYTNILDDFMRRTALA